MNLRPKKTVHIQKPQQEIHARRIWKCIFIFFTLAHIVAVIFLAWNFQKTIENLDAPIDARPQTQLAELEVIESRLRAVSAIFDQKTFSFLKPQTPVDPSTIQELTSEPE